MSADAGLGRIRAQLERADARAILVVAPFAAISRPSLGCHLLQACAGARGHRVAVLYANALFAARIGEAAYDAIVDGPFSALVGERAFARAAHGIDGALQGLGADGPAPLPEETRERVEGLGETVDATLLAQAASEAFADDISALLAGLAVDVVGFSTTFQQLNASIAIARRLAAARPTTRIIFGGGHCEGEMARGLLSLDVPVDRVFSGEAERSFPDYLDTLDQPVEPAEPVEPIEPVEPAEPVEPIIFGEPCLDLDALPNVDYGEYYEQMTAVGLHDALAASALPYETSRGCWWGQKHHCTFCGLGGSMRFREKSADRVLADLDDLLARHPTRNVDMADNIMPLAYFDSLLPRIRPTLGDVTIFYEQKANLGFERVAALRAAGVRVIQPGIEALSTPLLQLMRKGAQAKTNVALLRWCRVFGISVKWNLLYGFPGDRVEHYAGTADLLPLLRHFDPPAGPFRLSLDRFSPYHDDAASFAIESVRPLPAYAAAFPADADLERLAYHFEGRFAADSLDRPELVEAIGDRAAQWRRAWQRERAPVLDLQSIAGGRFILHDTRGIDGLPERSLLDGAQARALLGRAHDSPPALRAWAIERGLAVELDGSFVSLVTARPSVLRAFRGPERPRRRHLPVATAGA